MKKMAMALILIISSLSAFAQTKQPGTVQIPNTGVRKYYYYTDEFEKYVRSANLNSVTIEKVREGIEKFRDRLNKYQSNSTASFERYVKTEKDSAWLLGLEAVHYEKVSCFLISYEKCMKKSEARQAVIETAYKLGVKPFDIYRALTK